MSRIIVNLHDGSVFQDEFYIQESLETDQYAAEKIKNQKRYAYQTESDPLFFKWQRGEATEAEWLGKIAEIDARFS